MRWSVSPVVDAEPRHERPTRLASVDFWRGFVLCTIFISHVPGNPFEKLTFRNFGFSDSAEAFVFISGLALALAYGRRFARGQTVPATVSLGRRALKIYGVHLFLSLAGIAIYAIGAAVLADPRLMAPHGRDLVIADPFAALAGVVTLGHQFGYFNILPLYVLLVAMVPVLLALSRYGLWTMLGVSVTIYAVARLTGLSVPTWPMRGTWFFDPFAWQLLMAIGIACGLGAVRPDRPQHPALVAAAGGVVALAAFCATDGFGLWPGLFDVMRAHADLDKTMLGLGRLLHFLCLAYLVAALGVADAMRGMPWHRPLCLIGRHGLSSFAVLSLLAALGQVITEGLGHTQLGDGAFILAGLLVLYRCARFMEGQGRQWRGAFAGFGYAPLPDPVSSRTTL